VPVSMGVEDFAYYAQKVPASMFRLGVMPVGAATYPSLHNPAFNFNDDALPVGIQLFCELALRFLQSSVK
jgi:metal-dependent amidase/aminoacylase/carboxypeptidase family protein